MKLKFAWIALLLYPSLNSFANEVDIVDVGVSCHAKCNFSVTLKHADSGWDHYANQWDVLAPDGTVLGTRVLYHPHVNEQPFTRSLGNVLIPKNLSHVFIRAADSVHGEASKKFKVDLPSRKQ